MGFTISDKKLGGFYIGGKKAAGAYIGGKLAFSSGPPPLPGQFFFSGIRRASSRGQSEYGYGLNSDRTRRIPNAWISTPQASGTSPVYLGEVRLYGRGDGRLRINLVSTVGTVPARFLSEFETQGSVRITVGSVGLGRHNGSAATWSNGVYTWPTGTIPFFGGFRNIQSNATMEIVFRL